MRLVFSRILKIVLFPLTALLTGIVYVRNWLYDTGLLKSSQPEVFTINVGNLNLGGTGKTPHVEYLVKLLADSFKTSILSRGYKRSTKGFLIADNTATAHSIGDEPMQYYQKFSNKVNVVVCEDRVAGVAGIQAKFPDNQLVILDDAFQHRRIAPHFNILLSDYSRPFYQDYLVPVGKLRDIRQSAKRANVVIITKCPEYVSSQIIQEMIANIKVYTTENTPVFFSKIRYNAICGYNHAEVFEKKSPCMVVTAIAKPEVFWQYLNAQSLTIEKTVDFPDHFAFTRNEVDNLLNQALGKQIITTEKDMVKLKPLLNEVEIRRFFYVPIEITLENTEKFNQLVLENITTFIS
ncbi:tetraacyldisaccharide 4'-kinase [Emticicia sp. 17c]|uniref:tetraacyldisaccharide 4'-kinase n=1 Tax=Emticicia sp. 17c TaxID=3127704 RepID=UPI00301B7C53